MYNRYSMEIRDDDFVPLREEDRRRPAPPPPGPAPLPPGPHHPTPPPGPPPHHPAPPPHGDAGGRDLLGQLLGGLHLRQLDGTNSHHIIEAAFKAFARALRQAVSLDPGAADAVPSTKGVLV